MHLSRTLIIVTASLATAGPGTLAGAGEIIVPDDEAFLSVAIANANDGDIITLTPAGSPYAQFPGFGFADKALTIRGSTGNPADVVLDGVDLDAVMTIGPNASGTIISDLTIRGGYNDTLADSTVLGAGLLLLDAGALVTVENCVFEDNFATHPANDARGAGIYAIGTNVVVRDCLFQNNIVDGPGSDGGAIWFQTGTHLIEGCSFINNAANNTGGAVRLDTTVTQITGCTFTDNTCIGFGGAIWTRTGDVCTIDSCVFTGNDADRGGAIEINGDATSMLVRNCSFQANSAAVWGGAIYSKSQLIVHSSTFEGNSAVSGDGAISSDIADITSMAIYNSVFWGNMPIGDQIVTSGGTTPLIDHAIIEGGLAGASVSGVLDMDPQFVNAPGGDLTVAAGSPAIDAGNTTVYQGPLVDLAGATRGVDDLNTADVGVTIVGPVIDLGAFELQVDDDPAPSCSGDVNGDGMVNTVDLLALLAAWGACP